jgi:Ca2+:H+ antiporter
VPLALAAENQGWGPASRFVLAFLGLVPLAMLIGDATEALAIYSGPRIGALVNGTLANVADLVLMLSLLRAGQLEVLKSSIMGTIPTLLLVSIGLAAVVGGLKHGAQRFGGMSANAGFPGILVILGALIMPTIFGLVSQAQRGQPYSTGFEDPALELLSLSIAAILVFLYGLDMLYDFGHQGRGADPGERELPGEAKPAWSLRVAMVILGAATVGVALVSEVLSHSVEPFGESLGLSPLFLGFILLPFAGCMSELIFGVRMARRDEMGLVVATLAGAARQYVLFVVPILVFAGLLVGVELTLYFDVFQVIAVVFALFITMELARDGRSTWLEGAQVLTLYALLAVWFLLL